MLGKEPFLGAPKLNKKPEDIAAEAAANALDREQGLANEFEDPNLAELVPGFDSGNAPSLLHETVEAMKELVLETEPDNGLKLEFENDAELAVGLNETHQKDHVDFDLPVFEPANAMEIQKDISTSFEANQPEGQIVFNMESEDDELTKTTAKWLLSSKIMAILTAELSFDDFTESLLQIFVKSLNAQAGSLLEVDHKNQEFFFRATVGGGDPDQLKVFRVPCNKGIVGHVAESKQVILINDLDDSDLQLKAVSMSTGFETKSCLAAPIIISNKLYGVIELFNKVGANHFQDSDKKSLEECVKILSKALEVRFLLAELARRIK